MSADPQERLLAPHGVWPGLDGAAVLTVAIGCLGVLPVAGLAHDEARA